LEGNSKCQVIFRVGTVERYDLGVTLTGKANPVQKRGGQGLAVGGVGEEKDLGERGTVYLKEEEFGGGRGERLEAIGSGENGATTKRMRV